MSHTSLRPRLTELPPDAAAPQGLAHRLRRGRLHHARLPPRRVPQRRLQPRRHRLAQPGHRPRGRRAQHGDPDGSRHHRRAARRRADRGPRHRRAAGRAAGPDPHGRRAGQGPAPRHPRPEAARAVGGARPATSSKRCADAGIVLAVNQNMRYDQSVRAAKDLLDRGWLGEPVLATIDMRAIPHWMPWAEGLPSLSTFVMSIHHLDTFRYWFGTPDRVLASTRPDPRTKFPHPDGINLYILEYDQRRAGLVVGRRLDRAVQGGRRGRHRHPLARRGHRRADARHDRLAELPGARAEHAGLQHAQAAGTAGSARAGTRCGSPTPSSARWPSCSSRSRTAPSRRSAAATTWRRSPCARRCSPPRPSTASTTVADVLGLRMTPDLRIQQAVVLGRRSRGAASSPRPTVRHARGRADRGAVRPRPEGVACPLAHFACPFGRKHVAVVRVEDRPGDVRSAFRFLVLVARTVPPPRRPVRHLRPLPRRLERDRPARGPRVADGGAARAHARATRRDPQGGDVSLLLGSTQALVDGNRVLLKRTEPPTKVRPRACGNCSPTGRACELWPASFAFSDELGFHVGGRPDAARPTRTAAGARPRTRSATTRRAATS